MAAATASRSSATRRSTTPLACCTSIGPDLAGLVHAEPAALDHRRAAHADARVLGGDHHVAAAEQRGVAREAVARGDAHQRHEAAERGEQLERAAVQAGDDRHVDVARAPAAALGEQHHRQAPPLGDLEQAVLLEVVAHALGARQDGVVVGHRHARAGPSTSPTPADEAVGGRARDQLLARCAALLRGEQQRPVLDEAALVEQVGEVLARGAPAALVPARDRVGARGVQADLVALAHRREVRALAGRRGPARRGGSRARRRAPLAGLERQQQLALLDGVADRHRQLAARRRRPRRAPRAPSSSPRAPPAARPPPRCSSLACGIATTTPAKGAVTASSVVCGHREIIADARALVAPSHGARRAGAASRRQAQLASARCPRDVATSARPPSAARRSRRCSRRRAAARAAPSSPRRARRWCSAPATPTPS